MNRVLLRQYEEQILIDLDVTGKVIATGGSAVYSHLGMQHLQTNSVIVFGCQYERTMLRITNVDERGIARRSDQSLQDLYASAASLPTIRGYNV